MPSLQRQEGYLLIDNTAAGEGKMEAATLTCCHCQRIFLKNPDRVRARGYCAKCDSYVCDNPACNAQCSPFWKRLDAELTRIIHQGV